MNRPMQPPPTIVLGRRATLGDLAQLALADSVRRLAEHERMIGRDDDVEAVHQARVATRRLRSDLRTFARVLDDAWAGDLRDELRWLGELLGRVRDVDVLGERLREQTERLPEADRPAARTLTATLRAARARDRAVLLDALASPRAVALHDRLGVVAQAPDLAAGRAGRKARGRAERLARRPWKRLVRSVDALPRHPSDEQLHEVRKRAKHARYALEAIAPVTGARVARLAKRAGDLQTVLGDHHDAVVTAAWLRAAAADADDPAVAFAAGELAAAAGADAAPRRRAWRATWRRACRAADRVF
jgi:CHAD domain-containing protein